MIPRYRENQPGGCRKPQWPFQREKPRGQPTEHDMKKESHTVSESLHHPLLRH
jgi:hypothetical protein